VGNGGGGEKKTGSSAYLFHLYNSPHPPLLGESDTFPPDPLCYDIRDSLSLQQNLSFNPLDPFIPLSLLPSLSAFFVAYRYGRVIRGCPLRRRRGHPTESTFTHSSTHSPLAVLNQPLVPRFTLSFPFPPSPFPTSGLTWSLLTPLWTCFPSPFKPPTLI